jgi:hypothetical protein
MNDAYIELKGSEFSYTAFVKLAQLGGKRQVQKIVDILTDEELAKLNRSFDDYVSSVTDPTSNGHK